MKYRTSTPYLLRYVRRTNHDPDGRPSRAWENTTVVPRPPLLSTEGRFDVLETEVPQVRRGGVEVVDEVVASKTKESFRVFPSSF